MILTQEQIKELQKWAANGCGYTECARLLEGKFDISVGRDTVRRFLQAQPKRKVDRPEPGRLDRRDENPKQDNSRILVISDMHHPYGHPDTVPFLRALHAKYKFTRIVCIGDEADKHAMSFHDHDPDLKSPGDELRAAIKKMKPLYELFPVVDVIDSNHGSLAFRRAKHAGISRKYLRDYGDVLQAPEGWAWQHDLHITLPGGNECYFHHGLTNDAMRVVQQRGVCVVQGHFHALFSVQYVGNPRALLWGMQVGCLIDKDTLAFEYDNANLPRPVIGCGGIIDGHPRLFPMLLKRKGRWDGTVP